MSGSKLAEPTVRLLGVCTHTNPTMSLAKHWCFTINNYDEVTVQHMFNTWECKYLVMGKEVGDSETPHIQGYVVLENKRNLNYVKALCPTAHWEITRGNPKQASDYCKKDGDFLERGELPESPSAAGGEATRQKWLAIHSLAKHKRVDEFLRDYPQESFLHLNKFRELQNEYALKPRQIDTLTNFWYIGKSGSGKSRTARQRYPEAYIKPTATKWWPNYHGENEVIIDDVGKDHEYVLEWLKNWCDHYPFQAESKGSHTGLIRPRVFVITSQYHWNDITMDQHLRDAIQRRFTVMKFGHGLGEHSYQSNTDDEMISSQAAQEHDTQVDWDDYVPSEVHLYPDENVTQEGE